MKGLTFVVPVVCNIVRVTVWRAISSTSMMASCRTTLRRNEHALPEVLDTSPTAPLAILQSSKCHLHRWFYQTYHSCQATRITFRFSIPRIIRTCHCNFHPTTHRQLLICIATSHSGFPDRRWCHRIISTSLRPRYPLDIQPNCLHSNSYHHGNQSSHICHKCHIFQNDWTWCRNQRN